MSQKKVVLIKDIPGTGTVGSVKEVSPGFARYLFNAKLAVEATPGALKEIADKKSSIERGIAISREKAKEIFDKINGKVLKIYVEPGQSGKLHESVTSARVSDSLAEQLSTEIDKRKIRFLNVENGIKSFGRYEASVELFADPTVNISAKIFIDVDSPDSHI